MLDEIGRSLNFSYGASVIGLVREGRVTMGAAGDADRTGQCMCGEAAGLQGDGTTWSSGSLPSGAFIGRNIGKR